MTLRQPISPEQIADHVVSYCLQMSLLGAALAASLLLGADPAPPTAPLAALVSAERARSVASPPAEPPLPARHLPHSRAVERREDDCGHCRLGRMHRPLPFDHPDYPELLYVLATHFDEKRRYFLAEAAALAPELAAAAAHPRKAEQLQARRTKFLAQAVEAAEQMVKLLKALVTTPQLASSPHIEEALYLYALELDALGRRAEQHDAERRLHQTYPQSPYRPHLDIVAAHRALARRELTAARALYDQVLASSARELHAHAHLGRGWSYLRAESGEAPRPGLALAAFTRALELAATDDLLPSLHAGLVHAFAAAGRPAQAPALFDRLAALPKPLDRRSIALQERLALAYTARGQHRESAEVYRALQQAHPHDPERCTWQQRTVLAAAAARDHTALLREALRLGDVWQIDSDSTHHPSVLRRCREATLTTLLELTRDWRRTADPRADQTCAALARLFPDQPLVQCP